MKFAYVTLTLFGALDRGIKKRVLVSLTCSISLCCWPTPCASLTNSLASERFHICASGPFINFSMLSLLPVSGLSTWLARCCVGYF